MRPLLCCFGSIGIVLLGLGFALPASSQLRVVEDGTLSTKVTSPDGLNFTIDFGDRVGNNLFHSFREFSIPTLGSARFNHAPDIQNIFSRVTGGTASNINGLIQAQGTANLFLLNPAGILFGANAQLNIGGSFVGTTASSIRFADGAEFRATDVSTRPLLTVSAPIGVQFGQPAGAIQVQGTGLQLTGRTRPDVRVPLAGAGTSTTGLSVQSGKTLALIGSGVILDGGILSAPEGHLALGSVSSGYVSLQPNAQSWQLGYEQVQGKQNIQLSQQALLDASGLGNGSIQLDGAQISLTGGSIALIQNQGTVSSGQIQIRASEKLQLSGTTPDGKIQSGVHMQQVNTGSGNEIDIVAPQVEVLAGAGISSKTFGSANTGNIRINANQAVRVQNFSAIDSSNFSAITNYTYSRNSDAGNTENISISTRELSSINGGSIGLGTLGAGSTGNLDIRATESVELGGEEPRFRQFSTLFDVSFGTGNAGNLTLDTKRLLIRDGGRLGASTVAFGNAGNITVNASESVTVTGIAPVAKIPSQISSAGNILPESVRLLYNTPRLPSGNAGSVTINTNRLQVANGALVTVRNLGSGNAGNLNVNANAIYLDQKGSLAATTTVGNGGNMNLRVQDSIIMRRGSGITAEAKGVGNGGNLTINAPILLGLENSDIVARAERGNGGNIQITTQGIFGLKFRSERTPENDITASSDFGVNGSVAIKSPDVDVNAGLLQLPVEFLDAGQQVARGCSALESSRFVVTGRGGIPEDPTHAVARNSVWSDLRDLSNLKLPSDRATRVSVQSGNAPHETLVEATEWQRNSAGQVELIAKHAPTSSISALNCAGENTN
jgi:filamentous hemagglutinin family protein